MHEKMVKDDTMAIEINPSSSQMPIGSSCDLEKGILPTEEETRDNEMNKK